MFHKGQLRFSTSRAIFWKWALVIGLGVACAGGAFIVDAGLAVPPPMATAPEAAAIAPPLEATGTASVGGTSLTTASLDLPVAVETPPPATTLPPEKPRNAVAKAQAPSAKAAFETCLPACETRDPQVVGMEQPAPVAPTLEPFDVAPPPRKNVVDLALDGGKHLLRRVEGASHAVVHDTRRALDAAVDLVW